jgi:CxxC motif-containing protein (DUF1111 family)
MHPSPISLALAGFIFLSSVGAEVRADVWTDVRLGVELSWGTATGKTYELQSALDPMGPWTSRTTVMPGNGSTMVHHDFSGEWSRLYQVLETVPAIPAEPASPFNGGFEAGSGMSATGWTVAASQAPVRINTEAHTGSHSMHSALENVGSSPAEGLLIQSVAEAGGSIEGGVSYDFSFWIKQGPTSPSYVQQYRLEWLDASNGLVGGTGLQNFNGVTGSWIQITRPNLIAPPTAVDARISFRFVTGAESGGHGEVFIDDVILDSGVEVGVGSPEVVTALPVSERMAARFSWASMDGWIYQPESSADFLTWTPVPPEIVGDGGPQALTVPLARDQEFFRLELSAPIVLAPTDLVAIASGIPNAIGLSWSASPTLGVVGYRILYGTSVDNYSQSIEVGAVTSAALSNLDPGVSYYVAVVALTGDGASLAADAALVAMPDTNSGIVPLFNVNTTLEAPTRVETSTALITYLADRVRDRHAREGNFKLYDHYLSWYWEQRVSRIEIIDKVAKGGTEIIFNYTTLASLNPAEFRTFFGGVTTPAQYLNNQIATKVSTTPSAIPGETDHHYTATINSNAQFNRPLQIGDRVEIEISFFLAAPRHGRSNYYGTTLLYIVGEGIVPWAQGSDLGYATGVKNGVNQGLDSYPLPKSAWLGGQTTLHYQYSDEPAHRFKQMATNTAPVNGQPFMLGRRLHHTNFATGAHSEPNNPIFSEQVGLLGPKFIARSCVECHVNNGRSLPPPINGPMFQSVVRVGGDASGAPHPVLGSVLQPQMTTGTAEGSARISSYTYTSGQYADGTNYELRKPNYTFTGPVPDYYSVRVAPQLIGLGLLEAVSEETIASLADPTDVDQDGISGRMRTVIDPETGEPRLGRFTYKGAQARLSHQIAAALNADMGVTTSVAPILDGATAAGPAELSDTDLEYMTRYVALLGVAARRNLGDAEATLGEALFTSASCVSCHTPTLTTGPYHPMSELRNQTLHPFTDLLLHDMGEGLADNMGEGDATGAEWRTPPLWNLGLTEGVTGGEAYLHDGRARTLEEAILWHGGEAEDAKEAFRTMHATERAALIKYLKSL